VNILNMGIGSVSWWLLHGIGCKSVNSPSDEVFASTSMAETTYFATAENMTRAALIRFLSSISSGPLSSGCVLDYRYVELIHAAVQCVLGVRFLKKLFVIIWSLQKAIERIPDGHTKDVNCASLGEWVWDKQLFPYRKYVERTLKAYRFVNVLLIHQKM
jgi:hypothetical protein